MKNKALILTAVLSLILAAAAMQILPDQIPVHFGIDGSADRVGSKYELFIIPAAIIFNTVFGILLRRKFEQDGKAAPEEKRSTHAVGNAWISVICCTAASAVLLGIECVMICVGYNGLQSLQGSSGELYCSAMVILMGVLFMVMGNIMPKMKMNGLMGLRTSWSMKNEEVWARCQRMGGTLMFFGGAAIILAGVILRGFPSIITMMIIVMIILAAAVKGSQQIYVDWEREQK